jgi:hypothetical protein
MWEAKVERSWSEAGPGKNARLSLKKKTQKTKAKREGQGLRSRTPA